MRPRVSTMATTWLPLSNKLLEINVMAAPWVRVDSQAHVSAQASVQISGNIESQSLVPRGRWRTQVKACAAAATSSSCGTSRRC